MLLSKVPFSLIPGWHMSLHSEIWSMKIICLYLTVVFFFFLSIRKKLISSPWVFLQPLARVVFHLYPVNEIENSFKMKQKILLLISVLLVTFMMCSCTQKEPGSSFRDDSSLQQDKNIAYKQYMENKPTVNFFYADAEALSNTVYEEYIVDESEYTVKIAFSTDKQIKDVNITSLTYEEHGFVVDSVLYTIDKIYEK